MRFSKKTWKQITKVNDEAYAKIAVCKTENVGLQLPMVKNVGLGNFTSKFDKTKNIQHFIRQGGTTKCVDTIVFFR